MSRFRSYRPLRSSPLTLALLAGLAPTGAAAAEFDAAAATAAEPSQLERITVTAQKREQQVADVPISISAYSGEMLRKLGIAQVDELSAFAPGF